MYRQNSRGHRSIRFPSGRNSKSMMKDDSLVPGAALVGPLRPASVLRSASNQIFQQSLEAISIDDLEVIRQELETALKAIPNTPELKEVRKDIEDTLATVVAHVACVCSCPCCRFKLIPMVLWMPVGMV